jgi:hypothetical protein
MILFNRGTIPACGGAVQETHDEPQPGYPVPKGSFCITPSRFTLILYWFVLKYLRGTGIRNSNLIPTIYGRLSPDTSLLF